MLLSFAFVFVGLLVLSFGADLFIKASVSIANHFQISPLIIGMTIVAFGTSAPEAAVSWFSSYSGQAGLAVGNVLGSNLFNIFIVLGITSFIIPLKVNLKMIKFEVPFLILCSFLFYWFFSDYRFEFYEGMLFVFLFLLFNLVQVIIAKKEKSSVESIEVEENFSLLKSSIVFILGASLLIAASKLFVIGAEEIATALGVSDVIIGLTVAAIGTSLPEVAASVAAARKGESDMAIGNVIGSNIYNTLLVLGGASFFQSEINISPDLLNQDILFLVFASVILLPALHTNLHLSRFEGCCFIYFYTLYTLYLIAKTTAILSLSLLTSLLFYSAILFAVYLLLSFLRERLSSTVK